MSVSTNTTYRVYVEKIGAANPSEFIGDAGEVFYDPNSPTLKLSDGSTPGGITIAGGGGGGGESYWVSGVSGISTSSNVGIGTDDPQYKLHVIGDARITGILTVGNASVTIDGNNNTLGVGSSITIDGSSGVIYSSVFVGDGSGLVGIVTDAVGTEIYEDGNARGTATCMNFGNGFNVDPVSSSCANINIGLDGNYNFVVGNATSAGCFDIFIGDGAGFCSNNTFGFSRNTFIGQDAGCFTDTGVKNTFIGYGAGRCNTSGSKNTAIGQCAGAYNTTGCYNFFGGYYNGYWNAYNLEGNSNIFIGRYTGGGTSASNNIAFGCYSGANLTSGSYNNFFGHCTGFCNTTGQNNNFIGKESAQSNTTGSYNNFFGRWSGQLNSNGCYNTIIGDSAGNFNDTGCYNSFFGASSGCLNSSGNSNIYIGNFSGVSTSASRKIIFGTGYDLSNFFDSPDTTKDTQLAIGIRTDSNPANYWIVGNENFNVGIGTTNPQYKLDVGGDVNFSGTLYQGGVAFSGGSGAFSYCCSTNITSTNLTSHPDISGAYNNFFAGCGAGFSITSGSSNIFLGFCAGPSNTSGSYNNFFGYYTGYCNTTGNYNNFLGYQAGCSNTSGNDNNFLGQGSGCLNTSGSNNNFFGVDAGRYNTTGKYNNFFGFSAGLFNSTGYHNNFIGREAGNYNSTGCYNNFFGYKSGFCNNTGNHNIILGSYSGISTSASNKIILGRGNASNQLFDSPDTDKDTQLAIGIRTDSNPANYWIVGNENFNVGIGTTNPTSKLTVGGDVKVGVNTSQGVILTSPNGTQYRLIVNDSGTLSTSAV